MKIVQNNIDYLDIALKIIIYIFGIIIIYQLTLKILGFSPTETAILFTFVGLLGANMFRIEYKLGRLDARYGFLSRQFQSMATDIKEIKQSLKTHKRS